MIYARIFHFSALSLQSYYPIVYSVYIYCTPNVNGYFELKLIVIVKCQTQQEQQLCHYYICIFLYKGVMINLCVSYKENESKNVHIQQTLTSIVKAANDAE